MEFVGNVHAGWEVTELLPLNFVFATETKPSGHVKGICQLNVDLEDRSSKVQIKSTIPGQHALITIHEKKFSPFSLTYLQICSNARFVEIYSASGAELNNFQYISTVKGSFQEATDAAIFRFTAEMEGLQGSCRQLQFKFVSIKGSGDLLLWDTVLIMNVLPGSNMQIHPNIASATAGSILPPAGPKLPGGATLPLAPPQMSGSTGAASMQTGMPIIPPAANSMGIAFEGGGLMEKMFMFRAMLLDDVELLIEKKLSPVNARLDRIETGIAQLTELIRCRNGESSVHCASVSRIHENSTNAAASTPLAIQSNIANRCTELATDNLTGSHNESAINSTDDLELLVAEVE